MIGLFGHFEKNGFKVLNSRKGQRTNQKYRNLEGSDQQTERLGETELRKADRTVGVNCYIFSNNNNQDKSLYSITMKCGPLK